MSRPLLAEDRIHPSLRTAMGSFHDSTLAEVQAAIAANDVVVVGMSQNPFPKKVRGVLDAAGIRYTYLEYGSYLSEWKRRLALKMWTGWPTFPMVFVKGTLVGGFKDTKALVDSGEFAKLLGG